MTSQSGGGGSTVNPRTQWAHVAVDGSIPSLVPGAPLSLPFTVYTGGSPHQSWLMFTTTNGTVLLDTGVYAFTWDVTCTHTGSGAITTSLDSWQGFVSFPVRWADSSTGITLLSSASGFIDVDDPIALTLINGFLADITDITADLTIVKVH